MGSHRYDSDVGCKSQAKQHVSTPRRPPVSPPAANGSAPPRGATTALALSSFSDTTPVVIDAADAPLSLTVADVLQYIAPGAPRNEALMFLFTCKAAKLNPL